MASSSVPTSIGDIQVLLALVSPLLSSLLLSYLFTYGLQGILLVQVYNYYLSFPNDRLFWKVLVYLVLFAELIQTILATIDAFRIFSSGWGKFQLLDDLNLLFLTPVMSASIGLVCHCVFAYRIYSLSHSKAACLVIVLLALLACASGLAFGIKISISGRLSQVIHARYIYLTCGLWNGGGAVCDIAIAALMTFYLSRSSTGYRSTDVLLTRIIRLTIETGVLTATASLASAILFIGYRDNFKVSIYFVVPAIMLAKLYAVTILAMFNNRVVLQHNVASSALGMVNMEGMTGIGGAGGLRSGESTIQSFEAGPKRPEIRIGRSVVQQVWTDDIGGKLLEPFSSPLAGLPPRSSIRRSVGDFRLDRKPSISQILDLNPRPASDLA